MRLLLDLRPLDTPSSRRGVGRYTREITKALKAVVPRDWSLAGLSWSGQGADLGLETIIAPGPRRGIGLTDRCLLPGLLRRHGIDLYHATAYALPSAGAPGVALVLTLHDLVADLHPEGLSLRHRLAFRRTYRSAGVADRVVTISETTRKALLARYPVEPRRVVSIPIGVAGGFSGDEGRTPPSSGLPSPFLLYVGGLDPLKNVPFLLKVLERVRRRVASMRLVVAGEEGRRREAFRSAARRAGLGDHCLLIGYLEDRQLAAAYREAAAFVFPSRYEGFGLPPLEAMAAGCPVVSTREGALGEVLGDAAVFADPDDTERWAGAVLSLLDDERLRKRQVAAGRARAATCTWERTTRRTIEVYGEVLRERGGA